MQDDLSNVLDDVFSGKQRIVSYAGTGQYQATSDSTSIGTSACGLAALNCARIVFQYQQEDHNLHSCCWQNETAPDKNRCMIYRSLSEQASQEIVSVCSLWTTNTHLDVEDILDLPMFQNAFELVKTTYGQINQTDLRSLLRQMMELEGIVAAVITRSPEIVSCLKIPAADQDIFLVFDSHPRPSHPAGSGFTLDASPEATAAYLDDLLSIDSSILSDPSLRWQAQLLGHFSSHILIPKSKAYSTPEIENILLDASTKVLRLMVEVAELKCQGMSLLADNEYLTTRVIQLEESQVPVGAKGKKRAGHGEWDDSHSSLRAVGNSAWPSSVTTSDDYAIALQAQFDEEDRRLATERESLVQSNRTFECRICFETFQRDFVAQVKGCKHAFCRNCLCQHATVTIENRRYPIPCPACLADNAPRPRKVGDDILRTLGITESTFEIFQELQLSRHSILLHCRRCKQSMFVDKVEYQATNVIVCPLRGCNHTWCKKCERSIQLPGPQHSCDGTSELEHLMKSRGWRHCPGCQTSIQKESGCNHMTCPSPRCNTHFCYLCGQLITQSVLRDEIKSAGGKGFQNELVQQ